MLENQYRTLENQNRALDAKVDVLADRNKILGDKNVQLMSEKESIIQVIMKDKGFTRDQALLYIQGKRVYVSPIKKVKNFISRLHIF